jgi:hypothetical protein
MHGIDEQRSGSARSSLPSRPITTWRVRLPGAPVGMPAVDGDGRVFVATSRGRTVQLGPRGALEWERAVAGDVAISPAIGNDGTRYVLTTTATIAAWSPEGDPVFERALSSTAHPTANLLPLTDGTLLVAVGRDVLQVDRGGEQRALATIPEDILETFTARGRWLAVTRPGTVFAWSQTQAPVPIGSFLGRPTRASVLDDFIVATVEGRRVVALDLRTGSTRTLLDGPPPAALARLRDGVAIVGMDGTLMALGIDGRPTGGATLWPTAPLQPTRVIESLVALSDAAGRIAVAEPSRGVALFDPESAAVQWVSPAPCPRPSAIAPGAGRSIIVLCEDGTAARLADRAQPVHAE